MSWENVQLDQSKTLEAELRLIQHNWEWQGQVLSWSPKFALNFFRKDTYLLILREIQMDQNLGFIFHDRHTFLALLLM